MDGVHIFRIYFATVRNPGGKETQAWTCRRSSVTKAPRRRPFRTRVYTRGAPPPLRPPSVRGHFHLHRIPTSVNSGTSSRQSSFSFSFIVQPCPSFGAKRMNRLFVSRAHRREREDPVTNSAERRPQSSAFGGFSVRQNFCHEFFTTHISIYMYIYVLYIYIDVCVVKNCLTNDVI